MRQCLRLGVVLTRRFVLIITHVGTGLLVLLAFVSLFFSPEVFMLPIGMPSPA